MKNPKLSFLLDVRLLVVCEWSPLCCADGKGEGEPVFPCRTDGHQRGSTELSAAFQRSQEVKLQSSLSSLLFLPRAAAPFIFSVSIWVCVCVLIYSMCSPAVRVHVSVRDEGAEGARWLVGVSVLQEIKDMQADQSSHWVPSLMTTPGWLCVPLKSSHSLRWIQPSIDIHQCALTNTTKTFHFVFTNPHFNGSLLSLYFSKWLQHIHMFSSPRGRVGVVSHEEESLWASGEWEDWEDTGGSCELLTLPLEALFSHQQPEGK